MSVTIHDYMRVDEAVAYMQQTLGFGSPNTLQKWASTGDGPPFHKMGRYRVYLRDEIDNWAKGRVSRAVQRGIELKTVGGV